MEPPLKVGGDDLVHSGHVAGAQGVDDPLRIRSPSLVSKLPTGLWEMSASLWAQPKESGEPTVYVIW
jgi:hypothetical protein